MKKVLSVISAVIFVTFSIQSQVNVPLYYDGHKVSTMSLSTEKPKYSFKENLKTENNCLSLGVHFGAIGQLQHMGLQIFMFSMSVKGFYLDFGGWPQDHAGDVRVDTWDADKAILFHLGYTVPINKFIRLTPLVGYASNESGVTNGHNWSATSSGIHNQFEVEWSKKGFDPGCQLTINIKHFNIYGTFTRFAWYGGIGFEFGNGVF